MQAAWGKCNEAWMLPQFCQASCGRCQCAAGGSGSSPTQNSAGTASPAAEPASDLSNPTNLNQVMPQVRRGLAGAS